MNRIFAITDKMGTSERHLGGFGGHVVFGRGRKQVPFVDAYGNKSYYTTFEHIDYEEENIVPIGAYQYAFDKLFNIGLDERTTLRVGDLNDESPQMKIGVPHGSYKSMYYKAEAAVDVPDGVTAPVRHGVALPATHHIFGYMIGDGGCREDNVTVIAPNYKDRCLYRPIPFRMTSDWASIPQGRYYGRQVAYRSGSENPIISAYIKKFENPAPHIVHAWVTGEDTLSVVDDTVFSSTSSMKIMSYVEMNILVDRNDVRDYAKYMDATPRVSEFGLVSGWYNDELDDYELLTLCSHFARPALVLDTDDKIEAIYRLYAR